MSRRPTFINLFLIRLPIPAISSISHRISGIINFFVGVPTFVFLFLSGYLIDNGSWNASLFNFEVKFLSGPRPNNLHTELNILAGASFGKYIFVLNDDCVMQTKEIGRAHV